MTTLQSLALLCIVLGYVAVILALRKFERDDRVLEEIVEEWREYMKALTGWFP